MNRSASKEVVGRVAMAGRIVVPSHMVSCTLVAAPRSRTRLHLRALRFVGLLVGRPLRCFACASEVSDLPARTKGTVIHVHVTLYSQYATSILLHQTLHTSKYRLGSYRYWTQKEPSHSGIVHRRYTTTYYSD